MATKKDMTLLGTIIAAMAVEAQPFHFATSKEVEGLTKEGLVEQNPEITEGDKIATRATDAGIAAHNAANPNSAVASNEGNTETVNTQTSTPIGASTAAIITGMGFVPSATRGGKGRNLYDFDSLEVGGFIFVPASEAKPNPTKSLASTVSSATARFAKPTGETKTAKKTIYKVGEDGKRLKGEDGKLVVDRVEDVTVPVMEETRKFALESVEGGKVYGEFTAPADGAVIYRSA